MKVRFTFWIWYGQIVACLAIPVVIFDFAEPKWWSYAASNMSFGILFILAGVPTILFWTRIGKIEFIFSEKDERKMIYKFWKFYCEFFDRSMTDGTKKSKAD